MELLKRKDGSTSRRGLWDNIRENKGSGKKPTKAMLSEAKKIKTKTKKQVGMGARRSSKSNVS